MLEALADACGQHIDMKSLLELAGISDSRVGRAEQAPPDREQWWGSGTCFARHPSTHPTMLCVPRAAGNRPGRSLPLLLSRQPGNAPIRRGGTGRLLAAGRRRAARGPRRPVLRRGLSGSPRGPAGRQSPHARRRAALCRFGPSGLCGMRRVDVFGRRGANARRRPARDGRRRARRNGHAQDAEDAGLHGSDVHGRLALGRGRATPAVATSSTIPKLSPTAAARRAGGRPITCVIAASEAVAVEGFAKGRVLASYVHLHWASRPRAVERFLARCEERA